MTKSATRIQDKDSQKRVSVVRSTEDPTKYGVVILNPDGSKIKGPKGDKGDKGDTGTIDVGTTTTGQPGTNASVVNSGTTTDAILDFTIPRGDKGNGIASITSSKVDKTTTVTITEDDGDVTSFNIMDGEGMGDVFGPDSSTTGHVVLFDDNTGKVLRDSGVTLATVASTGSYTDLSNKPTIGNAKLTINQNGTKVTDITMNSTSDAIANITVPTATSDIDNDSGFIDKTVDDLENYTLSSNLATVATSGSYTDLSNTPTIPTVGNGTITIQKNGAKVDDFTTNQGTAKTVNITMSKTDVGLGNVDNTSDANKPISTATQSALDLKANTADLATVATTGAYSDLSGTPTIGDAKITIQKNGTKVDDFTVNATTAKSINITVPTKTSDITNDSNYVVSTSLATVATSGSYNDLSNKPAIPTVVNTLDSTSTTDALSAAQGKVLNDKIADLQALGKFLSLWDCATGLPISFPHQTPYTYSTGDYFLVESVDTTAPITNYRPNGSSYTGAASTTVETDEIEIGDMYIYDGSVWLLQINHGKSVSFANLTGQPSDNAALSTALNAKADTSSLSAYQTIANLKTDLTNPDNTHYPTTKAVSDAISSTGNGDMLKSVYDPNNKSADAFDYTNFINTPNLAAVATSGSYNDLSNKPTIPSVGNAKISIQKNGAAVDSFTTNASTAKTINITMTKSDVGLSNVDNTSDANKPISTATQSALDLKANSADLAAVATSGAYSDLSGTPSLATVATSGSYNDLSNKPTIPTVNNATLTIQKNGTTVKTFTANASSNVTANITVPTKVSDLTNDSGYITKSVSDLTNYTPTTSLSTVATSGSYSDLSNKPTIPTVNNSKITFTQNGTSKGDITLNQSSNETIALTDTTYSNITKSEIQTGTATTQRTVSASVITSALPRISALPNNILTSGEIWAGKHSDYLAMGDGRPSTTLFFCIVDAIDSIGIYWKQSLGLISFQTSAGVGLTIADKNLGATQVYNSGDTLSFANIGYAYQRGNNYGWKYGVNPVNKTTTQVNASNYGPGNYYSNSSFFIANPEDRVWDSSNNANLWGGTTDTYLARRGPCAEGWHIPSKADAQTLVNAISSITGSVNVSKINQYCKLTSVLPGIDRETATWVNEKRGGIRYSDIANQYSAGMLYLPTSGSYVVDENSKKAEALPLRPFKNEFVQPDASWERLD